MRTRRWFIGLLLKCEPGGSGIAGRPKVLNSEQELLAIELYSNEGLSVRAIADELGVSHMTVWRLIKHARSVRSE
ncbi:MAG: helix-turn-helix domain-containing protein [Candidatus Micrarchaeota archaeon]